MTGAQAVERRASRDCEMTRHAIRPAAAATAVLDRREVERETERGKEEQEREAPVREERAS